MLKPLPLQNIRITDPFFAGRIETARNTAIPYMWAALNDSIPGVAPSGCISNFEIAAGLKEGSHVGYVFQDSDLWKWIEGVAYSLATHPDAELEARADAAIELAAKAQLPDGYLNTYYTINGLDRRFTNLRDNHELYVAGHMFEAAAAYYEATGKRKLVDMSCRVAECIMKHIGPEEDKKHGYPGHEEIELGLARLYGVTGETKYLALAKYFLDARGTEPHYFDVEAKARGEKPGRDWRRHPLVKYAYHQAHKPVREQTEAAGHAVRQGYLLAGMTEVGALTGDMTLVQAADTVFDNIREKQMYITGGVGATHDGESFSFNYDLPPERCYTETCASISLIMTAARLNRVHPDGKYGDIVEKALYNGILSGVSLDGTKYFYVNPLEVWPERCERRQDMDVDPERLGWFGCACCPPNVLRTLTGLGSYIYAADDSTLLVDQYIASEATAKMNGAKVTLTTDARMPWDGQVSVRIQADKPAGFTLMLRVPTWAKNFSMTIDGQVAEPVVENGYIVLNRLFGAETVVALEFPMEVRFMSASLHTPNYAGKTALMRGPLVYCLEEKDNGPQLWNLSVKPGTAEARFDESLLCGVTAITADGLRDEMESGLYTESVPGRNAVPLTFVPYYAWGNRGKGEMAVWLRRA
ncbi:MAG: glycoside hydrolase family 127 protein [Clostridia bacterium]|nr:glycoside hydrolase family 127 protein [Clostridia bacterium]